MLSHVDAYDTSTLEPIEKVTLHGTETAEPNANNNSYHKKPVTLVASSASSIRRFNSTGTKGATATHSRTRIADARMKDLDGLLIRTAFPAKCPQRTRKRRHMARCRCSWMLSVTAKVTEQVEDHVPRNQTRMQSLTRRRSATSWKRRRAHRTPLRELRARSGSVEEALRVHQDSREMAAHDDGHSSTSSMQRFPVPQEEAGSQAAARQPSDYRFNVEAVEVALDCFEIRDVERHRFTVLWRCAWGHSTAPLPSSRMSAESPLQESASKPSGLGWATEEPGTGLWHPQPQNLHEAITARGVELRFIGTRTLLQL